MLKLSVLSFAGLVLGLFMLMITPAYANDYKAVALIGLGSGGPEGMVQGNIKTNSISKTVQNKAGTPSMHGKAALNTYVEAHCSALSDAVALGAAFSGACGGARAAVPGPVRN